MYVISLPALRRKLRPFVRLLLIAAAVALALLAAWNWLAPTLPTLDDGPAPFSDLAAETFGIAAGSGDETAESAL